MNLDFLVLVDVDINYHFVLVVGQRALYHIDRCVLEALGVEILRYYLLGASCYVWRELVPFHQSESQLQVFAFAFFHAVVVDFGDSRLLAQGYFEPHLVAVYFINLYLYLGEQTLPPEAFGGCCYLVAGDFHLLSDRESRIAYDYVIFVVIDARDLYVGNLVRTGH